MAGVVPSAPERVLDPSIRHIRRMLAIGSISVVCFVCGNILNNFVSQVVPHCRNCRLDFHATNPSSESCVVFVRLKACFSACKLQLVSAIYSGGDGLVGCHITKCLVPYLRSRDLAEDGRTCDTPSYAETFVVFSI